MPTPASAHSTPLPTEKTRDCTAPPHSPVAVSNAMIEKVPVGGSSSLERSAASSLEAGCAQAVSASASSVAMPETFNRFTRMSRPSSMAREAQLEVPLHVAPLRGKNAVHHRIAHGAVTTHLMMTNH